MASGAVIAVFSTPAARGALPASYDGPLYLVDDRAAATLSETVHPQGLVAVCSAVDRDPGSVLVPGVRLAVLLAEINDPGNAGTVLRTADAAGARVVAFGRGSVDAYNGKCVRAAAGSHFHLDLVRDARSENVIELARSAGLRVLATAGDGESDLDTEADSGALAVPTLWVYGNEARGLPADLAQRCDARVRIPLHGRAESLNLAAAAAVTLYASAHAHREHPPDARAR